MATTVKPGQTTWKMMRDAEGHREYRITFRVHASDPLDGPATVLNTPGLPLPGSVWAFDNDVDLNAYCTRDAEVMPTVEGEPNRWWTVEFKFTTKGGKLCTDDVIDDPLLEPVRISGTFTKYQEEATHDQFGRAITNSAWEQVRGPQVEFDRNKPQIRIEQNVPLLELSLFASMVDCVNDQPLWGLPKRCVKLSNVSWERKFHANCYLYYTRVLEFDIDYETFDRTLLDEGTKVLRGAWDRDPGSITFRQWIVEAGVSRADPRHFDQYKDWNDQEGRVILNGQGEPATGEPVSGTTFLDYGDRQAQVSPPPTESTTSLAQPTATLTLLPGGQITPNEPALYKVTALDDQGETAPFDIDFQIPDEDNRTALITITPVAGARAYRIYKSDFTIGGYGLVAHLDQDTNMPGGIHVAKYTEADFTLLGIPLTF